MDSAALGSDSQDDIWQMKIQSISGNGGASEAKEQAGKYG
jgi:hypothetical protein